MVVDPNGSPKSGGTVEMRGQWPGGWREEEGGQLALAIRGAGDGAWACPLCRNGQLHTAAEHAKVLDLAAKR
jgi:hypothetical protein